MGSEKPTVSERQRANVSEARRARGSIYGSRGTWKVTQ